MDASKVASNRLRCRIQGIVRIDAVVFCETASRYNNATPVQPDLPAVAALARVGIAWSIKART
jgi:hypothetical protein